MEIPTALWEMVVSRAWGATWARIGSAVGVLVVLLVLAFVIYSLIWKVWCTQHERGWGGGVQTWGTEAYSMDVGECRKSKSLFSF